LMEGNNGVGVWGAVSAECLVHISTKVNVQD